jgi:flagellin-like hook-associated protein FlgL
MAASTAAAQDGTTTEDLGTEAEPETVSRPASDVGNPTAAASAQPHQSVSTDSPTTARANNPAAPRVDAATSPSHAAHEREAPEPVPYAAPPAERGRGFWSSLGLILLGGLLGVLLTLLVAVIWTGTIDFAPQREVDALSRNLGTVQANQELLWEQMEAVLEETGDIQGRLVAVEGLGDRVGAVEADLEAAQGDLAAAQESLQTVTSELEGLRGDLGAVDERVTGAEEQIVVVEETLGGVEETLDNVETRIDSFNSFFDGLRNLLQQMDGGDATEPAPEG